MMIGQGAIANVGQRYYLSGRGLAGNDPPVVSSVTKTPEYQAYKAKVDAATTLTAKLNALGVEAGFYDPDAPNPSVDLRARRVLAQNLITDTCVALADGQDVGCVLVAALNGNPDNTQYNSPFAWANRAADISGRIEQMVNSPDVMSGFAVPEEYIDPRTLGMPLADGAEYVGY